MSEAFFRFYGDLNDFMPPDKRQVTLAYPFNPPVSVKHLIEAAGIPHTEVEIILANGESVDFSYLVQPDDRITVYPVFTQIDVTLLAQLRPPLSHPPRFILDNHLGRLARYLRLLGFDALYPDNHWDDEDLARMAQAEDRVMLTRDRGLLMRNVITHGYCLRTKNTLKQLTAVLHRFNLHDAIQPWQRCLRCNGNLEPVEKEKIQDRLEPKTKLYYHEFRICQDCEQIYWKGSHFEDLERLVTAVTDGRP
jgi:uncharacterized protein with PIN domain